MEPNEINNVNTWTSVLERLGVALIYAIITAVTTYFIVLAWIKNQVKTDTNFIDTRFSLLIKAEKAELLEENKRLAKKIEDIEHDYKVSNEKRLEELMDFIKKYK